MLNLEAVAAANMRAFRRHYFSVISITQKNVSLKRICSRLPKRVANKKFAAPQIPFPKSARPFPSFYPLCASSIFGAKSNCARVIPPRARKAGKKISPLDKERNRPICPRRAH
ncbi:MAG: hypothetical protein DBX55_06760 [Verrucomicrobia bacterium]|nr:MAG: hypothetical protein DBX55_06760 [Verrucomicrobiota bacterium]